MYKIYPLGIQFGVQIAKLQTPMERIVLASLKVDNFFIILETKKTGKNAFNDLTLSLDSEIKNFKIKN